MKGSDRDEKTERGRTEGRQRRNDKNEKRMG